MNLPERVEHARSPSVARPRSLVASRGDVSPTCTRSFLHSAVTPKPGTDSLLEWTECICRLTTR